MDIFQPIKSNPSDGDSITLCKILESVAGGGSFATGFAIPPYNDVVMEYTNSSFPTKPTEIIFKQNGTPVYYLALTYDGNGALTRVAQD